MAFTLTADQKVTLSVAPVDKYGNPASLDGNPSWTVSDSAILTVTPATDGLSAVVEAVGPIGTAIQVTVSADADLGEGVRTITSVLEVNVVGGEANGFTIQPGSAEPKE